jgi:Na+/proline symporter
VSLPQQLAIAFALAVSLSLLCGQFRTQQSSASLREFFWAGRSLRIKDVASLLLSSSLSLNGILYQAWLGYSIGWPAVLIQAAWCASFFWMATRASRIQELAERGTLHGILGATFGAKTAMLGACASIVGFTLLIGWEFAVAVSLFEAVVPSSYAVARLIGILIALVAAFYTCLGGIRANAKANNFQNLLAAAALIVAVILIVQRAGPNAHFSALDTGSFGRLLKNLGAWGLVTNIVFSLLWQFVDMSNWQSLTSGEPTERNTRQALRVGSVAVFFFPGVIGTAMGVYLSNVGNLTSDNIVSQLVINLATFSPWVCVTLLAGLMAAMLSTIDGYFLAVAQSLTWDLLKRRDVKALLIRESQGGGLSEPDRADSQTAILLLSRLAIVLVAIASTLGILALKWIGHLDLFQLVYVVTIAQLALAPSVLALLYRKEHVNGFLSILAGLVIGFGVLAIGVSQSLQWLIDGSATFGCAVAALALFAKRRPKYVESL